MPDSLSERFSLPERFLDDRVAIPVIACILALVRAKPVDVPHERLDSLAGGALEEMERAAIESTLRAEGGNRTASSRVLGIANSTLHEKIKKYGLS